MQTYRSHIPNGPTHTLCGLAYEQVTKHGIKKLPTRLPHNASCLNCTAKYYGPPVR